MKRCNINHFYYQIVIAIFVTTFLIETMQIIAVKRYLCAIVRTKKEGKESKI